MKLSSMCWVLVSGGLVAPWGCGTESSGAQSPGVDAAVEEPAPAPDPVPVEAGAPRPEPGVDAGVDAAVPPAPDRTPGAFVAIGDGYERIASTDGVNWTHHVFVGDAPGDIDVMRGVAFGGGSFLTLNNDRTVFRSDDYGVSWIELRGGVGPDDGVPGWLSGLVFAQDHFWGAGGSQKVVRTQDGVTWEKMRLARQPPYRTLAYGDGRWVAAGDDGVVSTSADGTTWTTITGGAGFQGAAYGAGRFVLVGHGMRIAFVDQAGVLEEQVVAGLPEAGSLRAATFGEGRFYVAGSGVAAVFDGTTWTVATEAPAVTGLAFGYDQDSAPILVGAGGSSLHHSRDGLQWARSFNDGFRFRDVAFGAASPLPSN